MLLLLLVLILLFPFLFIQLIFPDITPDLVGSPEGLQMRTWCEICTGRMSFLLANQVPKH